jgi:hypothetical protein
MQLKKESRVVDYWQRTLFVRRRRIIAEAPMRLSEEDSQQLQWLRARYIDSGGTRPATPYRLGIYAARERMAISDFGAHSNRWKRLFEDGQARWAQECPKG